MDYGFTPGTGTVSVSAGGTVVTGTGTSFLLQAMEQGTFEAQGLMARIASIASDTELTLSQGWPGTTITDGTAFDFGQIADSAALGFQISAELREFLTRLSLKGEIHYVDTAPNASLGDDGDTAILRSNGDIYEKLSGAWVLRLEGAIVSPQINSIIVLTQAEYDALPTPDANTLYPIKEA